MALTLHDVPQDVLYGHLIYDFTEKTLYALGTVSKSYNKLFDCGLVWQRKIAQLSPYVCKQWHEKKQEMQEEIDWKLRFVFLKFSPEWVAFHSSYQCISKWDTALFLLGIGGKSARVFDWKTGDSWTLNLPPQTLIKEWCLQDKYVAIRVGDLALRRDTISLYNWRKKQLITESAPFPEKGLSYGSGPVCKILNFTNNALIYADANQLLSLNLSEDAICFTQSKRCLLSTHVIDHFFSYDGGIFYLVNGFCVKIVTDKECIKNLQVTAPKVQPGYIQRLIPCLTPLWNLLCITTPNTYGVWDLNRRCFLKIPALLEWGENWPIALQLQKGHFLYMASLNAEAGRIFTRRYSLSAQPQAVFCFRTQLEHVIDTRGTTRETTYFSFYKHWLVHGMHITYSDQSQAWSLVYYNAITGKMDLSIKQETPQQIKNKAYLLRNSEERLEDVSWLI